MMTYNETKRLCAEGRVREAIEFALRLPPGSRPSKVDNLVFLGEVVAARFPEGEDRDSYLIPIIRALLKIRDIEKVRTCLLALHNARSRERISRVVERFFRERVAQWELVGDGL